MIITPAYTHTYFNSNPFLLHTLSQSVCVQQNSEILKVTVMREKASDFPYAPRMW